MKRPVGIACVALAAALFSAHPALAESDENEPAAMASTAPATTSTSALATPTGPAAQEATGPVEAASLRLPWSNPRAWNILRGPGPNHNEARSWDFQPPGAGSHNNEVLAVGAGRARLACNKDGQAMVELNVGGSIFRYRHLQTSAVKAAGITTAGVEVQRGRVLGRLHPNLPSVPRVAGNCGWGTASHLHLQMPRLPITIDGITFTTSGPQRGSATSTNIRVTQPSTPQPPDPYRSNLQPITGDWNGDGSTDIGLRRVSNGMFYLRTGPSLAQTTISWSAGRG